MTANDRPSVWQRKYFQKQGLKLPLRTIDCQFIISYLQARYAYVRRKRLGLMKKEEHRLLGMPVIHPVKRRGHVQFLTVRNKQILALVNWGHALSFVPTQELRRNLK